MKAEVQKVRYLQDNFIGHDSYLPSTGALFVGKMPLLSSYSSRLEEVVSHTTGSVTTSYTHSLDSQYQELNNNFELTTEQDKVVLDLISAAVDLEKNCSGEFNITLKEATDDEAVFSRRSKEGLHIISVDPFGEIMVSFSGYKNPSRIQFYSSEDYDAQRVIFDFLQA